MLHGLSNNGFPKWIVSSTIKKCNSPNKRNEQGKQCPALFLSLPYIGNESEQIMKKSRNKLKSFLNEKVKINVFFKTTKLWFFTSNKDKMPLLSKSFVTYEYQCPGCSGNIPVRQNGHYLIEQGNTHGT